MSEPLLNLHLESLRRSFDAAFTLPAALTAATSADFLQVRVGVDPWLVPVEELAGLTRDLQFVRLPTSSAGFLGLAAQRGRLLPLWSLRQLLGYPAGEDGSWLLLPAGALPLALAFDGFDGYLRAQPGEVVAATPGTGQVGLVSRAVQGHGAPRPILDLAAVFQVIEQRARASAPGA